MRMATVVGLLHPGEMGAVLGQELVGSGYEVLWLSEGRSQETSRRAAAAGLTDAGTLEEIAGRAAIVVAVCPPSAAVEMAANVAGCGFSGCYVDMNAISPDSVTKAGRAIKKAGGTFVDGGIVGPPPSVAGMTRLYLSGDLAGEVAALFESTLFAAVVLDGGPGTASALKACYAGWTKTTNALVLAIRAAARSYGVEAALLSEWAMSQPDLRARSEKAAISTAPKAWRFVGEMEEHASTFESAGIPGAFHTAAAQVFTRLAACKDQSTVAVDEVLDAIHEDNSPPGNTA